MSVSTLIDHTLLKPDSTVDDIKRICAEAVEFEFATVCIPPFYVRDAARFLENEKSKVTTVIGFPMGYSTIPAKVEEIKRAINDGVDELDVVVNICAVKNGDWNYVKNDIDSVTRIAHMRGKIIKIIFETTLLSKEEIIRLCKICNELKVDYVKTSTGFQGAGATVETVSLLKEHISGKVKIKASGGIRTYADAINIVNAGAHRIGCSASLEIMRGQMA